MSRQFYNTRLDALKSFIKNHELEYIYFIVGDDRNTETHINTEKLFKDFETNIKSTLGDFYYLECDDK